MKTRVGLWVACAVLLGLTRIAAAQSVRQPDAIAAFLLNFARFTDWPPDALPSDAPLVFCVADPAVADALGRSATGHAVGPHQVQVARFATDGLPHNCGLVYASGFDRRQLEQLVTALRGSAVLSVSDADGFAEEGGIIRLFLDDDGHMKFVVNLNAAERAHLHLSARLLKLAILFRD
jgi:hypothetical protein